MIKNIIVLFFIIICLDYPWIHSKELKRLISKTQRDVFKINKKNLIIFYICLSIALSYFVLPRIRQKKIISDSLWYSLLFSISSYGLISFHNMALFNYYNYPIEFIYGFFLIFITLILGKAITIRIKHIL